MEQIVPMVENQSGVDRRPVPIGRDTFDDFFLSPSASYRATAEADLLDGMQRGQEFRFRNSAMTAVAIGNP